MSLSKRLQKTLALITLFLSLAYLGACLDTGSGSNTGGEVDVIPDDDPQFHDENPTGTIWDKAKTVCDPLEPYSDLPIFQDRGLVGRMAFLTPEQPRYTSVIDYLEFGTQFDATLFFNRMFVPTRPWDRGFYLGDGTLVTTENGDTLYEYFAIDLKTELKLATGEDPGYYQMAVLSDDGAILSIDSDGSGYQTLVDNDGTHPTRMGCTSNPVYFDHTTRMPAQVKYYQGPRYHISLMVLWRPFPDLSKTVVDLTKLDELTSQNKFACPADHENAGGDCVNICHIPPGNPSARHMITVGASAVSAHANNHGDYFGDCVYDIVDAECGHQGNSRYFDSTQDPPAPQLNYFQLMARGWKVLGSQNYNIPEELAPNPCVLDEPEPEGPLEFISIAIGAVSSTSATITFKSSIPATAQIHYTNLFTGATGMVDEGGIFSTSHSMVLSGLQSGGFYSYVIDAQSPGGQSIMSDPAAFFTP